MVRIQDHIPKLAWVIADKVLFILYGVVAILQIRALPPSDYGLYALLVSIQTWIFVVADSLVLQGIVQFGADRSDRARVDAVVASLYTVFIVASVGALLAVEPFLRTLFREERFTSVAWLEAAFCLATIPRAYCLRLLQRDIQPRQIFWIDAAWFGSMTIATIHGLWTGWLRDFHTLAAIAISGIALSSLIALLLSRGLLRWKLESFYATARRLLSFGIRQMSAGVLHTSVRQLDVTIAQVFFGTAMVGVYQAAKTIFRLFELGMDAATSLLYPAAVSYHHNRQYRELYVLLSKGMSVVFVSYLCACLVVWIGADFVAFVLGERYSHSSLLLRLLSLAGLIMPMSLTGVVLVAIGHYAKHARITAIAAISALLCFAGTGISLLPMLFPLGAVAYYTVLSTLDWITLRRTGFVSLRPSDLLRSPIDALGYLRHQRQR